MTEAAPPDESHKDAPMKELATSAGTLSIQPRNEIEDPMDSPQVAKKELQKSKSVVSQEMSPVMRKPTFWFPTWSDTNQTVQLQVMARGLKFQINKVEGLYYLSSENKGADQLRGYRKADLRLCFHICKMFVFS